MENFGLRSMVPQEYTGSLLPDFEKAFTSIKEGMQYFWARISRARELLIVASDKATQKIEQSLHARLIEYSHLFSPEESVEMKKLLESAGAYATQNKPGKLLEAAVDQEREARVEQEQFSKLAMKVWEQREKEIRRRIDILSKHSTVNAIQLWVLKRQLAKEERKMLEIVSYRNRLATEARRASKDFYAQAYAIREKVENPNWLLIEFGEIVDTVLENKAFFDAPRVELEQGEGIIYRDPKKQPPASAGFLHMLRDDTVEFIQTIGRVIKHCTQWEEMSRPMDVRI